MLTFHSTLPCKRIHGIERSQPLFDVCQRNIALVRGDRLRVERADATEFELPDDVTFVYLYNSFQDEIGRSGGEQHALFIARVRASLDRAPRRLVLLLYDCEDDDEDDGDDNDEKEEEEEEDEDEEDEEEDARAAYDRAFRLLKEGKAGPDAFCVFDCGRSPEPG